MINLPTELIKKIAGYLDTYSVYLLSIINNYINKFHLTAWLIPYHMLYNIDDRKYIDHKGIVNWFKEDFNIFFVEKYIDNSKQLNLLSYLKDLQCSLDYKIHRRIRPRYNSPFHFKNKQKPRHPNINAYLDDNFTNNIRLLDTTFSKSTFFIINSIINKKKINKNRQEKFIPRVHEIIRVPWFIYKKLYKYNLQVLALIY